MANVNFYRKATPSTGNGDVTFSTRDHLVYLGNGTSATLYGAAPVSTITNNDEVLTPTTSNNDVLARSAMTTLVNSHNNLLKKFNSSEFTDYKLEMNDTSSLYGLYNAWWLSGYESGTKLRLNFSDAANPWWSYGEGSWYMGDYPYSPLYLNVIPPSQTYTYENPHIVYLTFGGWEWFTGWAYGKEVYGNRCCSIHTFPGYCKFYNDTTYTYNVMPIAAYGNGGMYDVLPFCGQNSNETMKIGSSIMPLFNGVGALAIATAYENDESGNVMGHQAVLYSLNSGTTWNVLFDYMDYYQYIPSTSETV